MSKRHRSKYTLEYKQEAVRLVGIGQSIAMVASTLGIADQTLHNWQGASGRPSWRCWQQAGECGAGGTGAAQGGALAHEDGA